MSNYKYCEIHGREYLSDYGPCPDCTSPNGRPSVVQPYPRDAEIARLEKELKEALHEITEQRLNLYQVLPNSVLPPVGSDYHTLICAVGQLAHNNTVKPRADLRVAIDELSDLRAQLAEAQQTIEANTVLIKKLLLTDASAVESAGKLDEQLAAAKAREERLRAALQRIHSLEVFVNSIPAGPTQTLVWMREIALEALNEHDVKSSDKTA